jgi:N-acyl-D-amino-acid deacylase
MYDLAIRNVHILDGSGAPAQPGDVGIAEGRIVDVGTAPGQARREFDAAGKTLAPGFVDTHTHDDGAMLRYPGMAFKLAQGVTTCVLGNCGFSVAPVAGAARRLVEGSAILAVGETPVDWDDLDGYAARVEARRPAVNGIALIGHNTLRYAAFGNEQRPPTDGELARMQAWVDQAMAQGACGLSTGLIYEPGRWSTTEEIIALCERAAPYGGVYATHMRNEGEGLLEAVEETLRIGRAAGVPVHISHHKATGPNTVGFVERSLAETDAARAAGQAVTLDMYPYTAGSTRLEAIVRLGRVGELEAERLRLASVPGNEQWQGWALAEVARDVEMPPEQAAEYILQHGGRETVVIQFSMREEDVETNIQHPWMMIGSDGLPVLDGLPHPRLFGTYPRVLGVYVRERGVVALPEAVRRMTSLPAQVFGLSDRGEVRPGYWADLVLFDPDTVIDTATYDDPKREPEGISLVVVNGQVAYEDGRHTGAGSGRMLRFRR